VCRSISRARDDQTVHTKAHYKNLLIEEEEFSWPATDVEHGTELYDRVDGGADAQKRSTCSA